MSLTQFTNLYPIQKTLRFELKPIGKTEEHIQKNRLLENDQKRADDYDVVKDLIDSYHKWFIEETLQAVSLDWSALQAAIANQRTEKSPASKKALEAEQALMRKKINKAFESHAKFKLLFSEKLFKEILPAHLNVLEATDEQRKAVDTFKRFSGYFLGFHENRKNIYSADDISTGIPHRIVQDNFPKFLNNAQIYAALPPEIKDAINAALQEDLNGRALDEVFSIGFYNTVLTQKGIDFYNLIIGGRSPEPGQRKIQGINEIIHQYRQQYPDVKIPKMVELFKQILSDRESQSFIPKMYENDKEVQESIVHFHDTELRGFTQEDREVDVLTGLANLAKGIAGFDLAHIHVTAASLPELSKTLLEEWNTLQRYIETYANERFKTKKDKEKFLKSETFSLDELNAVLEHNEQAKRIQSFWNEAADERLKAIDETHAKAEAILRKEYTAENKMRENPDDIALIKEFLDAVMDFMRWLKPFCIQSEVSKDDSFYGEFEPLYKQLALVVPLFNRVRNYATQKLAETAKIKLNFENPTLANGWDKNKEKDNTSILLMKDGKYFLGVFNVDNKPGVDGACVQTVTEACYTKMIYKLLPGPNKMLPKVFFSKTGREAFDPPQYILDGYEAEKHKKGDAFDKTFCHNLIDYFKDAIQQHPDWKQFDFQFSDTASYEDISGFYREVQQQGYKLTFTNIPERIISQWVDEGKLYLFQLSSKDFAAGTTGKQNLHTLYWTQLFSPENLKDVVVKLNGEAELFYRRKSIEKPFIHRVNEKMVNRRDRDGNLIPEKIFGELFRYFNAPDQVTLGEEATKWKDKTVVKPVKHEITKDRRYTEDKFLFHVPLTLNFKADGARLNEQVRGFLINNPEVNIIGIDRGERNLIYVTIINQKGEIIFTRSFNEVNGFDYHEKLAQREHERDAARKSWQSIGKIAELKEGYLSQVVHEITKLMIQHNAIIVLEDLNFGFKRGRFKVERQVYQKFEHALIDKLNYLVFKERKASEPGGVLKGYQFTEPLAAFKDVGKQTGMLFYVPAAYTSKIDPVTGFANLLNLNYDNERKSKELFSTTFDFIRYNSKEDFFEFGVNYEKAKTHVTDYTSEWTVCTTNEPRYAYNPQTKKTETVMVTERLKAVFAENKIAFEDGRDLKKDIVERGSVGLYKTLIWLLKLVMQMRNSNAETGEDYILSPVRNKAGVFYDSRKADDTLPKDADANGAYHIALKGLYLLQEVFNKTQSEKDKVDLKITHPDWLAFAQKRHEVK